MEQPSTEVGKPKKEKCLYDDNGCLVEHHKVLEVSLTNEATLENFEQLRKECLEEGRLYEDPDFPTENSSIYYNHDEFFKEQDFKVEDIEWKRPKDICDLPKLFNDGPERFDAVQGKLGNCLLVAALANLTLRNDVLHRVVPNNQGFKENYAGIFHFRFWQCGRWVTVIIDDRLPTKDGELLFMHSDKTNEFWSALLEKAYAKLHSSYQAIEGGWSCVGIEDFTGGLMEKFSINDLRDKPIKLFKKLLQAHKRGSLMCCYLNEENGKAEPSEDKGIEYFHAYSITCVKYIEKTLPKDSEKMRMIRVRNPWGNETEWKGAWSDESPEWDKVSEEVKKKLDLKAKPDGEFWMEIKDFCETFDEIDMTHIRSPDDDKNWKMSKFEGSWIKGISAGGCTNFPDTFHTNPQYPITLLENDDFVDGDEDNEDEGEGNKCTVIVSLSQKNRRALYKFGKESLWIGFSVFKISDPENTPACLDKSFFEEKEFDGPFSEYKTDRTSTMRFHLPSGSYVIVPTTYYPDEEGEFLIRILSEKQHASDVEIK